MESTGKSYARVLKEFRKSELVLHGWRSAEQSVEMEKKYKTPALTATDTHPALKAGVSIPGEVNKECFNEDGEPDIRLMTSAQALKHLGNCGFALPVMGL